MGGGRRGNGRSPCAVNIRVLRRRLESHLKNTKHHQTPAEIIDHLHSSNPEYRRFKRVILAREIEPLLRQNPSYQDESGDPPLRSPCRKKLKKIDGNEDRLVHQENQHLRRRSMGVNGEPMADGSSTSSPSTNMSSGDEEDEEATDGALSDAVYGEKVEPEFDLIQWTLRRKYSEKKGVAAGESNLEEKNLEVEEISEQDKQINLLQTQRIEELEMALKREVKGLRDGELKENNGPMFSDLGGMEGVLEQLKREVMVPLYCLELHRWLGVKPVSGILLHGPPGCGKTKLAHAIANETGVPFYQISATEVVSGVSGTSEENIRDLFLKAYRTAPSIVFIDEIDAIASKRENLQREMERRIVTQLMTCMDESHRLAKPADKDLNSERSDHKPGYVLVIGATNRPDAVDPALRRPGRFDREIGLGVPDERARIEILSVVTRPLRLEGSFDLVKLARSTPGFVGADLHALATDAGYLAMQRIIDGRSKRITKWWQEKWMPEEMENLHITMNDFEVAAKKVQPSSLREGFSTIPNVKWEDVGGLDCLRQEFDRYIVRRIKHPEDYEKLGLDLEMGFLLYGPPGCGKTLIAKALANEAGANFIHIKGPELLNKFVGESELAVRTLFRRARACPPCILFFDEVDALTTKREKEGSGIGGGLLNQLLIELDGSEKCRGVFVIGATNRPDVIDPAFLRPGRFGKHLYIPLPNPHERGLILKALARKKPLDASVDLSAIGQMKACENLSGADLAALMNEAAMAALDEKLLTPSSSSEAVPLTIKMVHFELTLEKVSPSVSDEDRKRYHRLSKSGI